MYSQEDATEVEAPSLAAEQRYEYKKLMMNALADVCTVQSIEFQRYSLVTDRRTD